MAKGISIHVGVNAPEAQGLTLQPLGGCVNDATKMRDLAQARGFTGLGGGPPVLMTEGDATYDNVLAKLGLAATALDAGDIFLFTFAGHGTSRAGSAFETNDERDETIVLFDKFVLDNVLRRDVWPNFKAGVRVVMIADSCYSGTVAMAADEDFEDGVSSSATPVYRLEEEDGPGNGPIISGLRAVPQEQAVEHFAREAEFYTQLNATSSAANVDPIQASLMLLAACPEGGKTRESTINGETHGVYTRALLNTWNTDGPMTYQELLTGVHDQLTPQTPVLMMVEDTPSFIQTEAFKI